MIAQDKLGHLLAGAAIAAVFFPFGWYVGLAATVVAGVLKELRDMRGHGTPDPMDAIATAAGGAALCLWYLAIEIVIQVQLLH